VSLSLDFLFKFSLNVLILGGRDMDRNWFLGKSELDINIFEILLLNLG
jgi:hypothetical protein